MARARSTAKPTPGVINRVHRPCLSADAQQLAAQYRPPNDCRCGHPDRQWLMEFPIPGADLQFYCSNCGRYRSVPQG
jgi:hypothetical protein